MALVTRILTVDLVDINALFIEGISVSVSLTDQRLVYPITDVLNDTDTDTLYPRDLTSLTNAHGVATFNIMPSIDFANQLGVGNYTVTVGRYQRVVTMPNEDIKLSRLGEPSSGQAAVIPVSGVTETRVQELINATDLSALQGEVGNSQVVATIARDTEVTSAITALVNGAPANRNTCSNYQM